MTVLTCNGFRSLVSFWNSCWLNRGLKCVTILVSAVATGRLDTPQVGGCVFDADGGGSYHLTEKQLLCHLFFTRWFQKRVAKYWSNTVTATAPWILASAMNEASKGSGRLTGGTAAGGHHVHSSDNNYFSEWLTERRRTASGFKRRIHPTSGSLSSAWFPWVNVPLISRSGIGGPLSSLVRPPFNLLTHHNSSALAVLNTEHQASQNTTHANRKHGYL